MKKLIIVLIFTFIIITIFIENGNARKQLLLNGFNVVIDPGHGGIG